MSLRDGVVVKRFHHPDPVARLFDHARAVDELDVLRELSRRGLAVPAPIEVRHEDGAWEIVTEWIQGAVSLEDVLSGRSPWPAPPEALARSLGRLLAEAHALGLDHPDLHPGNVLVRGEVHAGRVRSRAWLVDLRRARLRETLATEVLLRDLAHVAAGARETVSERFRARFLSAYLRTLPAALAGALPPRLELAERIEIDARLARRAHVERQRLRWTRSSSVCRPFRERGERGFRSIRDETESYDSRTSSESLVRVDGLPWSELREVWYAAARLTEHALASARPVEIVRTPEPRAVLALPAGARPLAAAADRHASALGLLLGGLRDRGLSIEPLRPEALFVDPRGRIWIGPLVGASLVAAETDPAPIDSMPGATSLLGHASPADRNAFADSFVRAQRAGPRDRARVRARLSDG